MSSRSSQHCISTMPVTPLTAQVAAEVRAAHNLKTPDAIQLATALTYNADVFLACDRDFPEDAGLKVLNLEDLRS